jgi:aspartate/methionine/tyrosine aminotransferase
LVEYPLLYDDGWVIDLGEMERRITVRTRVVVVVHPNNPTGNFVGGAERAVVEEICRKHGLALIVDEVFLDYAVDGVKAESFAGGSEGVLSFVLSGVSKVCALPQMKVSWIAVSGPEALRREAMERLEVIADTFLSVSAPVQLALPGWLAGRRGIQEQIRERMGENLVVLGQGSVDGLLLEGGWTVVVRLPALGEGGFELAALAGGVVVQPGTFYGLGEGRAVLSLLTPVEEFAVGVGKLEKLLVVD